MAWEKETDINQLICNVLIREAKWGAKTTIQNAKENLLQGKYPKFKIRDKKFFWKDPVEN